jgi:uncharacterized membrane protein
MTNEKAGTELDKVLERLTRRRRVHPALRTGDQLTFGERSADKLRNGMGSWIFVFAALAFLAIWMLINGARGDSTFDPYPFILLNLVLSCLAAMQGAILLIAAKRSDQISAELAQHDYDTDVKAEERVEALGEAIAKLHHEHQQLTRQIAELSDVIKGRASA